MERELVTGTHRVDCFPMYGTLSRWFWKLRKEGAACDFWYKVALWDSAVIVEFKMRSVGSPKGLSRPIHQCRTVGLPMA